MKKLKKLLVAVPLALASSMAFVGCSDPHKHNLKLTGANVDIFPPYNILLKENKKKY